ncbi:MAG: Dabb family protein [Candidatus Methylacidiphilales bacterium]
MITHVVIFWVDKPHAEHAERLLEAARKLGDIPGVENFRVGPPTPSPRGAVDDSFGVAISMDFADQAVAQAYQEHPLHADFIEGGFKQYCRRFVVYDFQS